MNKYLKYAGTVIAAAVLLMASPAQARKTRPSDNSNHNQTSQPAKPNNQKMSAEVKKLYKLARTGDAKAQNALGSCYLHGKGVEKNDSLAYLWFSQSAKQKYPKALVNVATCVRKGIGVKQDSIKARDLFLNAIGNAINQKNDTVVSAIEKAAKKDVFLARTLAYGYYHGKGVKRNLVAAKQYLKYAIDNKDESAYYPYAQLSLRTGDHPSAQRYFGKAYENNIKDAGYWYGRYLITGEGGNPDPKRGYMLVYPYAEKGLAGAQVLVANCLMYGVGGFTPDRNKAVKFYSEAAKKGNAEAIWELALFNAAAKDPESKESDSNFLKAYRLMCRHAMHSSENRFKNWIEDEDTKAKYKNYILFLQGIKILADSNSNDCRQVEKIAKELVKQKYVKDGKVLEGLYWLSNTNPKRNIKKGLKALEQYIDDDYVAYLVAYMRVNNELEGSNQKREGYSVIQRLADNDFGPALSTMGDLYFVGECGLTASEQRAISYWLKAYKVDGLSATSAHALATMYEQGIGGLKENKQEANKLRNKYTADYDDVLLNLIPDYSKK